MATTDNIDIKALVGAVDTANTYEAGGNIDPASYAEAIDVIIAATTALAGPDAHEAAHAALWVHATYAELLIEEAAGITDPADQPR